MIGVVSKESERACVEEFFQLFKTPWEFYVPNHSYDVIITTKNGFSKFRANLILIYGSETKDFDSEKNIMAGSRLNRQTLLLSDIEFPIYGEILTFDGKFEKIIGIKGSTKHVGIKIKDTQTEFIRIGYNLFEEISFLLTSGQPKQFAHIPTLEIHISILRQLILNAKIPLIEIPPIPEGHRFMVCLTHDVDFLGIREHKFDRSMLGFIYRVFFPYSIRNSNLKISWLKIFKNIKALLSLPGVYFGLFKDFWLQIDRYLEIEKSIPTTYFFIPFKNQPGDRNPEGNSPPQYRGTKYNLSQYSRLLENLSRNGNEIALHGIDAWHNSDLGRKELEIIQKFNGGENIGVRMHWLYFSDMSPYLLEKAGFKYDSTLGYNDAIGYRSGTTQVFRFLDTSNLLELPLHIQDTSMFYKKRMGLSEVEAIKKCQKIINDMKIYGGVLTINWHQRSLGPERNWDTFYVELLRTLRAEKGYFLTANQAVDWFAARRSLSFDDIRFSENKIQINLNSNDNKSYPPLSIRIHRPPVRASNMEGGPCFNHSYIDLPWSGQRNIEIVL